jgi:hypothetical protein
MSSEDRWPNALTAIVERARTGLARDVQPLLSALPTARFLLPLAHAVPSVPPGQSVAVDRKVDLSPHYLPDGRGQRLLALFTYFGPLDRIVPSLGWKTDGEDLQLFTLPGLTALQLAHRVVDAWHVMRLVIDPGVSSELILTRNEIDRLLGGEATSLSEYVGKGAQCLPNSGKEQLPPGLVRAVELCLKEHAEVRDHRLESVFDPARDAAPRIVLRIWATESAYRNALVQAVTDAVQNELPPPGLMEIRFE